MKVTHSFHGKVQERVFDKEVVIGRRKQDFVPDLDLSFDLRVSRPHARVWEEASRLWIQDLNSARGTKVNGEEIRGKGKRELHPGDTVAMGETSLWLDFGS